MGKSRKSVKRRTSVKVTRSKKRKVKQTKATALLPKDVREELSFPLNATGGRTKTQWDTKRTLKKNYEDNKVASDVNATIGMDIDGGDGDGGGAKSSNHRCAVSMCQPMMIPTMMVVTVLTTIVTLTMLVTMAVPLAPIICVRSSCSRR